MTQQICDMLITLLNDDHGVCREGYIALMDFLKSIDSSKDIIDIDNATEYVEDRVFLHEQFLRCVTHEQFKRELKSE